MRHFAKNQSLLVADSGVEELGDWRDAPMRLVLVADVEKALLLRFSQSGISPLDE